MTAAEMAYKTSATQAVDPNDLVTRELSQVFYIASRIRERLPQHVELDELVSAGTLGLIEAARSFDNSKNVQFRTFAKFRIRGAIVDSLRDTDWGSRYMRRKGREIAEATSALEAKLGRHVSEPEIAVSMGIDVSYLRKLIAQLDSLQLGSQNVAVSSDRLDSLDVIESAPNLDDPDPLELFLNGEMKAQLAEAISKLSEREQLILSLYYREELTMKEIAKVVGVALSRVSQIRQEIIVKLRGYLQPVQPGPMSITNNRGGYFEHA